MSSHYKRPVSELQHGSLTQVLTVRVEPTNDDGHCGVCPGRGQKQSTIFQMSIVISHQQDQETREADGDGYESEDETMLQIVGDECDGHC